MSVLVDIAVRSEIMNYVKGYYSLVQYCPDESRAEAVNLGVILFCPDREFLDIIISRDNERVQRLFGNEHFEPARLDDAKMALQYRIRLERGRGINNQEDFLTFVNSRTNGLLITTPRPLKTANPAEELRTLYNTLVQDRNYSPVLPVRYYVPEVYNVATSQHEKRQKSVLLERLDDLFTIPRVQQARVKKPRVVIPIAGTVLSAPYGFMNGKLNLIVPMKFNNATSRKARELALEGDLLQKHEDQMETPASLWIVLPTSEDERWDGQQRQLEALFQEYKVPVFLEEHLEDLEEQIEATLH